MKKARVIGWHSPWSGDEHDPIPAAYRVWFPLYRATRRLKHRLGLHDWEPRHPLGGPRSDHCHWCGANRSHP